MSALSPERALDAQAAQGAVLVVDDHVMLAQTLALTLRGEDVAVDIAPLESRAAVLAQAQARHYAVVLLDLDLGPEVGDGADLVEELTATGAQVVVVTGSADRVRIATAVERGAAGWVGKHQPFSDIVDAVREARLVRSLLTDAQRQDLLAELREQRRELERQLAPFERLTPREAAVLRALATGDSPDEIAAASYVSISTVRSQIRAVLLKLRVNSQVQAIAAAHESGWVRGE